MVALVALLSTNLLNGRTGRAFEAIRNDELAAEVLGVPTRRTKILAFAYAGALAGFAGTFYRIVLWGSSIRAPSASRSRSICC
jgi:branched-chain amino acid transport system permease protein